MPYLSDFHNKPVKIIPIVFDNKIHAFVLTKNLSVSVFDKKEGSKIQIISDFLKELRFIKNFYKNRFGEDLYKKFLTDITPMIIGVGKPSDDYFEWNEEYITKFEYDENTPYEIIEKDIMKKGVKKINKGLYVATDLWGKTIVEEIEKIDLKSLKEQQQKEESEIITKIEKKIVKDVLDTDWEYFWSQVGDLHKKQFLNLFGVVMRSSATKFKSSGNFSFSDLLEDKEIKQFLIDQSKEIIKSLKIALSPTRFAVKMRDPFIHDYYFKVWFDKISSDLKLDEKDADKIIEAHQIENAEEYRKLFVKLFSSEGVNTELFPIFSTLLKELESYIKFDPRKNNHKDKHHEKRGKRINRKNGKENKKKQEIEGGKDI